jgi:hypothetical protein
MTILSLFRQEHGPPPNAECFGFKGAPFSALTQGRHRNYVFPLYTPAGYLVTSEAPADHPHHNSCWIAADHVHCKMPAMGGRLEDYTYNFYPNENFQGRAPGSIVEVGTTGEQTGPAGFQVVQDLEWRGPVEWAAPAGRLAAREKRTISVTVEPRKHVIDIESRLSAADWDFTIGPTRHAYFNVRVAESIAVTSGGTARSDRATSADAITREGARWVDYTGPIGRLTGRGYGDSGAGRRRRSAFRASSHRSSVNTRGLRRRH